MRSVAQQHLSLIDDAVLVEAAKAGDAACIRQLFERHRPRLYATALSIIGYRAEAEDAVHDTFLTVLTRLGTLRDPAAVGPWMRSILRNHCLMELRRSRRQAGEKETENCFLALKDDGLAESQIEGRELRDWVWSALGHLSEPVRAAVMLRYFGNYSSYEEIAAVLGVPLGTVRSRLFEAKLKLSEILLASAGLADETERRTALEKQDHYAHVFQLPYQGRCEGFLANFADDLYIRWSTGRMVRGRVHLDTEMDDDLRIGVRIRPVQLMAAGNITVLEGRFENPKEHPQHCPPGLAVVMFDDGRQVRRLHLHLSLRPPVAFD